MEFPERRNQSVEFSSDAINRLNFLNAKLESIQIEIGNISRNNGACRTCKISCCTWQFDMFRAIDRLLRKYSNNPLEEYVTVLKPKSDSILLRNYVDSFFVKLGYIILQVPQILN